MSNVPIIYQETAVRQNRQSPSNPGMSWSRAKIQERSAARVGAALLAGTILVWSTVGQAAMPRDSYADLAREVVPAVVNISSIHDSSSRPQTMPDLPFEFPEGSPFKDFFGGFWKEHGSADRGQDQSRQVASHGSGFIIDPDGHIVTNYHVIADATEIKVKLDDKSEYIAKLIGADELTDLALLKIDTPAPLPAVAFGDSSAIEVGDRVLAVGNPFGLGGTVTAGILSARSRYLNAGPYDDFLQIDAPVNQGNSGGPTFDMNGMVIGVNTAIVSPNQGNVGIGFAIPANLAKPIIEQLRANGKVERDWIGVRIQSITPEIASAVGLDEPAGAMITSIEPGSPAESAKLRQGDVILLFAGMDVTEMRDLPGLVARQPAGTIVKTSIWRDHQRSEVSVKIGQRPASQQVAAAGMKAADKDTGLSKSLGATLTAITPEAREKYGIPESLTGVMVVDLEADGPGSRQGLRIGDVIKQVGQTKITTPADFDATAAKAASAGQDTLLVLVSRHGEDLFLGFRAAIA